MQKDWTKPQRQSPVALLVAVWKVLKSLWPLLFIMGASLFNAKGNEDKWQEKGKYLLLFLGGVFGIVLLFKLSEILRYFYFRYYLSGQKIVLLSGIFVKKKVEMPFEKIQSINIRQTIFHKITQTCSLTIDTAGSAEKELQIDAIALADAHILQSLIQVNTKRDVLAEMDKPEEATGHAGWKLTTSDMLKLCISENHFRTFFIILGFAAGALQNLRELFGFNSFEYVTEQTSLLTATLQSLLVVFTVGILASMVVSFVLVVIRYYGFSVTMHENKYTLQWGLLETQNRQIGFGRLQFISWSSTWLRRLMGIYVMRFHLLAEANDKPQNNLQIPITTPGYIPAITQQYREKLPATNVPFTTIHRAYIYRRMLIIGLPVTTAFFAIVYPFAGLYSLFILVWLVYFAWMQIWYQRNFKIWVDNHAMQVESGSWGRVVQLFNYDVIQSVNISTTPWQRSHHLANLILHLPGENVVVPFLPVDTAKYLADYLLAKIEFANNT